MWILYEKVGCVFRFVDSISSNESIQGWTKQQATEQSGGLIEKGLAYCLIGKKWIKYFMVKIM